MHLGVLVEGLWWGSRSGINKGILAADKHGHWEIEIPQDLAKLREEAQTFVTDRIVELEKPNRRWGGSDKG